MDTQLTQIAQASLDAAKHDTMTFPQIVATLTQAGFESYAVDFRRETATYYRPDGDSVVLPARVGGAPVAEVWNPAAVQDAIREAQRLAPGYTYLGFCAKVVAAGCAGYVVSFLGRRAVYLGRTAETHVERFPQ